MNENQLPSFLVRCGFGLGNRVAAIANGLSRFERIRFVWRVNARCPLRHDEVFPSGIPNVDFVTDAPMASATRWAGRMCWDWDAAADRETANAAYGMAMGAMTGEPSCEPDVVLFARFHFTGGDPLILARRVVELVSPGSRVFILTDMHRAALASELSAAGISTILPVSPELAGENLPPDTPAAMDFISDWKTLLIAPRIIACDSPTSLLQPARAAGMPIEFVA